MIPILALQPVTRLQYPAPVISGGRPIRQDPVSTQIQMSVQPAPDSARQWLPSGYRIDKTIFLYGYFELVAGTEGDNPADRVIHNGKTYEVVSVKRYPAFLIQPPHWEAYAVEVQAVESMEGQL